MLLKAVARVLRQEGARGLLARILYRKRTVGENARTPSLELPLCLAPESQRQSPELSEALTAALKGLPGITGEHACSTLHLSPAPNGADFGPRDAVLFGSVATLDRFLTTEAPRQLGACAAILVISPDCFAKLTDAGIAPGRVFVMPSLNRTTKPETDDLAGDLARWLIAANTLTPNKLDPALFASLRNMSPETRLCLSLPETPARRDRFLSKGLKDFKIFDGIRQTPGWQGCGWSYATIARAALTQNTTRLIVCEDDVTLSANFRSRLTTVERYLDEVDWDLFSGLLTDVPADCRILHIEARDDLKFIHLDYTIGMVFNIYNRRALERLAAWTPRHGNVRTDTVDVWLGTMPRLRVITTLPFIAGHDSAVRSTIFGFANRRYDSMIRASEKRLERLVSQKIERHKAVRNKPQ